MMWHNGKNTGIIFFILDFSNTESLMQTYHVWSGRDVTEEVDRNPSADEHCCSERGESFTAPTAGRVSASIEPDDNPFLL